MTVITTATVSTVSALVVALTFFASAILKARKKENLDYVLLLKPDWRLDRLARFVMVVEMMIGLLLWSATYRLLGGIAAASFLVCASAILVLAVRRGFRGACGCFGAEDDSPQIGPMEVLRNLLLVTLSVFAILSEPKETSLGQVIVAAVVFGFLAFAYSRGRRFARLVERAIDGTYAR